MLNNLDVMSPHNLAMAIDPSVTGGMTPAMVRQKLVILGGMAGYVDWPRDDETWEVWGCNAMWQLARDSEKRFRADRWFELHPWRVQSQVDKLLLNRSPVPVYMLDLEERDESPTNLQPVRALVPKAVEFPLAALLKDGAMDYFTCTFAYQIALALAIGFKDIALVGLYLKSKREGIIERANVEFWAGLAMGHQVNIHCPPLHWKDGDEPIPLLRAPFRYGYDYDAEKAWGEKFCLEVADGLYRGWQST